MATVLRKRKIIDTHYGDGPVQQRSLASFGRVTKAGTQRPGKKVSTTVQPTQSTIPSQQPLQKRRRVADLPTTKAKEAVSAAPAKRQSNLGPSKAGEPRRIAPLKGSAKEQGSPTQGAREILEAFVIRENAAPANDATSPHQELVELHSAFLSALSLHYAHNGTATPADVASLGRSIEQLWGKRRVTVEDMRRVLGIASHGPTPDSPRLTLVDFGSGKLRIEHDADESRPHAQPLPVAALKAAFARSLLALHGKELPLAPVVPFVSQAGAQNAKGAARLADIRAGQLNARTAASAPPKAVAAPAPAPAKQRGASLLSRILAKETHAAAQPAGPTPEQAARRAALQRLEDVVPVLAILGGRSSFGQSAAAGDLAASLGMAPAAAAVSFTMPAVVQHLQQSLKHPLAADEGVRCVELLAEVLPRWATLRRVGSVTTVSFRGTVGRAEWMGRIRACLEEM